MTPAAIILTALGGILLLGLGTDILGRRTPLPRVTLLLILGVLIGPEVLDLIPVTISERFELIADVALLMIGFLLGGRLTMANLRQSGAVALSISLSAALATAVVVALGLGLVGIPPDLAVLLGCIAVATAPAATVDTVLEAGVATRFSSVLLQVVALDDVWGLMIFSLAMAGIGVMQGAATTATQLFIAIHEIGGAVILGVALGLPAAYLTGRVRRGQPMLTEALGIVFLCGGLAMWLEVSFLIAAMTLGATIVNLARHHDYPFHAIEGIEWPFMVIFFMLAGATLEFTALSAIGIAGSAYIVCRVVGKVAGTWLGGWLVGVGPQTRRWVGLAMLPQAGCAMGMALIAANQFPQHRPFLLTVVIASTVFFELLGPVLTRMALSRVAD